MLHNDWGITQYPFVPGHEIIGTIAAKGAHVQNLSLGQRVGLGWHSGYCMTCHSCMSGDHGDFADKVRALAPRALRHCRMVSTRKVQGRFFAVELPFSIRSCNSTLRPLPKWLSLVSAV